MAASSSSRGPDMNPEEHVTESAASASSAGFTDLQQKWLKDLDSDESETAANPHTARKTKGRGRGRPRGDAGFRSRVKRQVQHIQEQRQLSEVQTATVPGSIEHARAAKAAKHLQRIREREAEVHSSATVTSSTSSTTIADLNSLCLPGYDSIATLHLVGTNLQRDIMAVAKQSQIKVVKHDRDAHDDDDDDALVDFVLDTPSFASQRAIAKILKTPRAKVESSQTLAGPALLNAHTWMTGALFSCVSNMLTQPNPAWRSKMFMTSLRYDETPLKLLLKGMDGLCPQAKVLQSDFKWSCLLEHSESKQLCTMESDVLTALHVLDHQTGETLLAATSNVMNVPEIHRFSQMAPLLVHHVCTDKHSANLKCESIRSQLPGRELWTKVHSICDVHKLYRATTCSLKVCEADVSGVLAIGLAHQANAGIYRSIVVVLGQLFLEHMHVNYEEPPQQFRPFRESVLDCFLPVKKGNRFRSRNIKRRHIISRLLNGDWESENLEHYCQWNCCHDMQNTMEKSMRFLAWALCPGKCPKYCRSRWTRYDEALDWTGLLSILCKGKFLKLLMERTLGKPARSPTLSTETGAKPSARPAVQMDAKSKWKQAALQECGVWQTETATSKAKPSPPALRDIEDTATEPSNLDANAGDGQPDWKAFNEKKKTEAVAYVATDPGPRIVGMKTVVDILLTLMLAFLHICSARWEKTQKAISLRGEPRSYPVLEAALGTHVTKCMESLIDAFHIVPNALPSWGMQRSVRNHIFRMIANALCGIHALLRVQREGFPFQWFRILRGEFDHVYSFPHCMHDELTREMVKHFPTSESAKQASCIAITETIATSFTLDTVRIEARHASNREQTMQRGRGWQVNMSLLNARFVCMQFATHQGRKEPPKKTRQVRKRMKKPAKGGGAWRAFIAHRFRGSKFSTASIKAIANEYRNLGEDEKEFYQEAGRAATLAHKSGHKSFPRTAPTVQKDDEDSPNEQLSVVEDDMALLKYDDTNLDLAETYNDLKLALFRKGREESAQIKAEDKFLEESLVAYSKELSVPSLFSQLPEGFAPGLQPFPGLSSALHRLEWQPPIKGIAKARFLGRSNWKIRCISLILLPNVQ